MVVWVNYMYDLCRSGKTVLCKVKKGLCNKVIYLAENIITEHLSTDVRQ